MIKRYRQEVEFFILIIGICVIWFLGNKIHIDDQVIRQWLEKYPLLYRGVLYIFFYVIITFFVFFSKDLFWLLGAVLFGVAFSTVLICIAEIINAFILFNLARSLGRSYVEKTLAEKYSHLDEKLGNINFFWLFIFRAAPLIPYRFMDLAAGLTKIDFKKYITAALIGSPIKMLWIQFILFGVGKSIFTNPYAMVDYFLAHRTLLLFSLVYLVLVIMVIVKMRTIR